MTTIVCNRECMAADMRVTTSGAPYPAKKIFRIGVSLFGTAGEGFPCLIFVEWLKTNRNRNVLNKQWPEHFERDAIDILELNPGGIYRWDGWGIQERVDANTSAVGSGQLAALALLDHGSTPEDAVKAAAKYDEFTGHGVQVEYLLPTELVKPRRKRAR